MRRGRLGDMTRQDEEMQDLRLGGYEDSEPEEDGLEAMVDKAKPMPKW